MRTLSGDGPRSVAAPGVEADLHLSVSDLLSLKDIVEQKLGVELEDDQRLYDLAAEGRLVKPLIILW